MYHLRTDEEFLNVPPTSYNNPDMPRISVNLADVLDHIGFSEHHREQRVKVGMMSQMHTTIGATNLMHGEVCLLHMGSYIEGTTADGMDSDRDVLLFCSSVKAYCNKENTKQTLCMVLIPDKITPTGYTKLQAAYQGCVINDASDINLRPACLDWLMVNFEADSKGRLMVAHFTDLSLFGISDLKHGPADTRKNRPHGLDGDLVRSFLCDDITGEMTEWCIRDRIHDWPSKDTRDLFKTLGCFVVPVGHPSSPEKNLEWRMSFSLQERHLMWHLNPTQYHCFMLLKLIKTFLIKPQFGDALTSYHCKTLLFYTIERHEQGIWVPEKLILCIRMCLIMLHDWISDKYIPNYFIPKENMFVKMNAALKGNYNDLKLFVAAMSKKWMFLFQITFSDLGKLFLKKINDKRVDTCIIKRRTFTRAIGTNIKTNFSSNWICYINQVKNLLDYLDVVLAVLQSTGPCARYKTFEENMQQLYKQEFAGHTQTQDTPERLNELTKAFQFPVEDNERCPRTVALMERKSVMQILFGTVLAARYFQTGSKQYLLESDIYLELGKSLNPMLSMLVKATVLLKQSLFEQTNSVLNAAEITSKEIMWMCVCYEPRKWHFAVENRERVYRKFDRNVFGATDVTRTLPKTTCLYFELYECDMLPSPLIFESYIPIENYKDLPLCEKKRANAVVVDPVMYMYYLQFLNNQHNHPGEAAVSLQVFENTLFERLGRSEWPGHTDTWLNVLGDIFIKKGWTRLALRCFKYSDKVRPLHNAVIWHVMFLLFSPSDDAI